MCPRVVNQCQVVSESGDSGSSEQGSSGPKYPSVFFHKSATDPRGFGETMVGSIVVGTCFWCEMDSLASLCLTRLMPSGKSTSWRVKSWKSDSKQTDSQKGLATKWKSCGSCHCVYQGIWERPLLFNRTSLLKFCMCVVKCWWAQSMPVSNFGSHLHNLPMPHFDAVDGLFQCITPCSLKGAHWNCEFTPFDT